MKRVYLVYIIMGLFLCGCAARPTALSSGRTAEQRRAELTLDQIVPAGEPASKTPVQTPLNAEAKKVFQTARKQFKRRRWADALKSLHTAVQLAPKNPDIRLLLAQTYLKTERTVADLSEGKVRKHLAEAVKNNPNLGMAYHLLGRLDQRQLMSTDKADRQTALARQALKHYRRALLCPDAGPNTTLRARVLLHIARTLEKAGYTRAALTEYRRLGTLLTENRKALLRDPELKARLSDPGALGAMQARTLRKSAQRLHDKAPLGPAEQLIRKTLAAFPKSHAALLEQARIQIAQGRSDEALATIMGLLSDPASRKEGLELVGRLYRRLEGKALTREMTALVERFPEDLHLAMALADLLAAQDQYDRADQLLRRYEIRHPKNPVIKLKRAQLMTRQGRNREALMILADALITDPKIHLQVAAVMKKLVWSLKDKAVILTEVERHNQLNPPDWASNYVMGLLADAARKPLAARRYFRKTIKSNVKFAPAWADLAAGFFKAGQYKKTLRVVEDALNDGIANHVLYRLSGRAYVKLGRNSDGLRSLGKALQFKPKDLMTRLLVAQVMVKLGELAPAQKQLQSILKIAPRSTAARGLLINVLLRQKHFARADKLIRQWRRQSPNDLRAALAETELLRARGKLDAAIKRLNKLIEKHPDIPNVQTALIELLIHRKKFALAEIRLRRLLAAFPPDARRVQLLADLLARKKQWTKVIRLLDPWGRAEPKNPLLAQRLAHAQWELGRPNLAIEALLRVNQHGKMTPASEKMLVLLCCQQGRFDRAAELIRQWLAKAPDTERNRYLRKLVAVYHLADRLDKAEKVLRTECLSRPASRHVRKQHRQVLLMMRQFDRALKLMGDVKAHTPEQKDERIQILLAAERFDQAATAAAEALKSNASTKQRTLFWHAQATALFRNRQFSKALNVVETWLKDQPNSLKAGRFLDRVLFRLGRGADAVKRLAALYKAHPDNVTIRNLWLNALARTDPARAINEADRLIRKNPKDVSIALTGLHLRLPLHGNIGKPAARRAEKIAQKLLKQLEPNDPRRGLAFRLMLEAKARAGDVAGALQLAEENYLKTPHRDNAIQSYVSLLLKQRRFDQAVLILTDALKLRPRNTSLLLLLGHAYIESGRTKAGLDVLVRALTIDPRRAVLNNDLGYLWAQAGKHPDRAERMLRLAVQAAPDNAAFLDSLGWVLYKKGNTTEALRYLQRSLDQQAHPDPVVLDHFADTLWRLGRKKEATQAWKRALKAIRNQPPHRRERGLMKNIQEKIGIR